MCFITSEKDRDEKMDDYFGIKAFSQKKMLAWKCKICTRHVTMRRKRSFFPGFVFITGIRFFSPRTKSMLGARTRCCEYNILRRNPMDMREREESNRGKSNEPTVCLSLIAGSQSNECEGAAQWRKFCVTDNQSRKSRAPQSVI